MNVYLGARALLIAGDDSDLKLSMAVPDFESAVVALEEWLGSRTDRPRIRLWIGGGLMRPFMLPSLAAVRSVEEIRRITNALAPERTGLGEPCEVRIDGAMAIALPTSASMRLARMRVRGKQARVTSIQPWWAKALQAALRRDSTATVVAVQDCDAMTFLCGAGGEFTLATTLSPLSSDSAVDAAMKRLLLAHEVPRGSELHVRLQATAAKDERDGQLDCLFGSIVEHGR